MNEHCVPSAPTIDGGRPWRLRLAGVFIGLLAILPAAIAVADTAAAGAAVPGKDREARMWMTVGDRRFAVTLADTRAARAFAARLPLTLDMTDLNGNEKKFDLPTGLPADPRRPGTIRHGDLMLYGTNTVVVFYLTFDSPYSYTRLGRVADPDGLPQALGKGSVEVEFAHR